METSPQTTPDVNFAKLADHLGLKTDLARSALGVAISQIQCLDRKQQDYGPSNLIEFGAQGVLVRLSDKRSRIINLRSKPSGSNENRVALNESESDSWLDLSNYALIGYLMVNNIWPKAVQP